MNAAGLLFALPLLLSTVTAQSAGTIYDLPGPTVPIVEVRCSCRAAMFLTSFYGTASPADAQVAAQLHKRLHKTQQARPCGSPTAGLKVVQRSRLHGALDLLGSALPFRPRILLRVLVIPACPLV